MKEFWRRWGWPLIKLIIACALIIWLMRQGKLDVALLKQVASDPLLVVAALLLNMALITLAAVRWRLLLSIQDIPLSFSWAHRVTYIGYFFNAFLPSAVGGDAMRVAYVARAESQQRVKAVLSVFFDRLLGLYSLCVAGLLVTLSDPAAYLAIPAIRLLTLAIVGVIIGLPLGLALLYVLSKRSAWIARALQAEHPNAVQILIHRGVDAMRLFRRNPGAVMRALGASILSQFMGMGAIAWVGVSLQSEPIAAQHYAFGLPWAWIAGLLPVTPGGLGVGEAAFDHILRWVAGPDVLTAFATIFLAFRILSMLATAPGLIAYILYKNR
ncbi:lysylphosphatidylglycerol synthase transmembrane domain-containing protein [Magnetofaba australis]|uniref:Uncharacterized protein n=1 Tax=Magnetofaba australis IT-1 TaxID=1434232 RepID=A0A1Y2JZC9_9PROT|nr:lysylphosphatidylglycerol synthase transmembrane domain-containing protein [Magnetofaba australis]OSM00229.1 hypothetical protein MAIT1_00697 [Magnetofaba australis IT-1]